MSEVSEYADYNRAPCNDGAWQQDHSSGKYEEVLSFGGGYSVSLVDFILNGIEPYKGCLQDIDNAYDYDNGFSKRTLKRIIDSIALSIYTGVMPPIKIYRAVPNFVRGEDDVIHDGDWITLSPFYARNHGDLRYTDNYHILSMTVPANHIYWDGQHLSEFGYDSRQFEWDKDIASNQTLDSMIADAYCHSAHSQANTIQKEKPLFHEI